MIVPPPDCAVCAPALVAGGEAAGGEGDGVRELTPVPGDAATELTAATDVGGAAGAVCFAVVGDGVLSGVTVAGMGLVGAAFDEAAGFGVDEGWLAWAVWVIECWAATLAETQRAISSNTDTA